MKFISWNVNGLRAVMKKNFTEILEGSGADVYCIQETKMQEGQEEIPTPGYRQYWDSAERKGYSGTLTLTKKEPLSYRQGLGIDEFDHEGRVVTLEFPDLYSVNVYAPNAQNELKRIDFRMAWEDAFREYVTGLAAEKSVVICGDMNVAHEEIDLKNPGPNRGKAGFSDEERGRMTMLLDAGFIDTWRYFYPDREGVYSWWSYRFHARDTNAGWRIDYFLVSEDLKPRLKRADILNDIYGSDHCPVLLELADE